MATVFWDRKGVHLVEFMPKGTTINATLRRLRYAIQNRRRGLLSSGVLLHDNGRPHAAARTQAMLQEFCWEVFEHPAYSPDLAPSDFHLFPNLKEFLGGRRFKSEEEVKDAVKEWLNGLAAEVYDEGIQKLVTCYDKCLNVGDDYVEK
jgi:histone-lysine N-methyltransferase SETMAR